MHFLDRFIPAAPEFEEPEEWREQVLAVYGCVIGLSLAFGVPLLIGLNS